MADQRNAVRVAAELGDVLSQPEKRCYLIEQAEIAGSVVPDARSQEPCNEMQIDQRRASSSEGGSPILTKLASHSRVPLFSFPRASAFLRC